MKLCNHFFLIKHAIQPRVISIFISLTSQCGMFAIIVFMVTQDGEVHIGRRGISYELVHMRLTGLPVFDGDFKKNEKMGRVRNETISRFLSCVLVTHHICPRKLYTAHDMITILS